MRSPMLAAALPLSLGSLLVVAIPRPPAQGRTWLEVRAGPDAAHTCGITTVGQAFCWGSNNSGQLGDGTTQNRASPVPFVVFVSFVLETAAGALDIHRGCVAHSLRI